MNTSESTKVTEHITTDYDEFFEELQTAVENDSLVLPSLPDVALKIREAAEDEDITTQEIADILGQDGALSVRLLKVVNSPLYPSRVAIDDLHMAVNRLGILLVRDLVTNLAMKQMYQPTSVMMEKQFRSAWSTSVNVAAICQMMAMSVGGFKKEQALLAGLIHNIGTLPILLMAEHDDYLFNDEAALSSLIMGLQGRVGSMILKKWDFSNDLVEVISECHNFNYDSKKETSLVDLVQVALLHGGFVEDEYMPNDFSLVPAFSKLDMDSDVNVIDIEENQEAISSAKQSLAH